MASDPALVDDLCTYMEAVSGDGGLHNAAGVWWLSPDIQLTGPTSGADKADPGVSNTVDVTIHSAPGNSCNLPAGTESLSLELWVANPSLVMAPNNSASTAHIDSIGMQLMPNGGSESYQFHWTPPQGAPPTDPQSSGHKCLIARAYADPLIPSDMSFFAPDDRHVAQHNICIVPCGGPGAVTRPSGGCTLDVLTVNPDMKKPQKTRLRAVLDLNPDPFVRDVVLKRLKRTKGFGRLSPVPPRRFEIRLRDVPKARVIDQTKGGKNVAPSYEVEIVLEAAQLIGLRFAADLSGGKIGDAHIFHLTHVGAEGQVHGGLTVVMLPV